MAVVVVTAANALAAEAVDPQTDRPITSAGVIEKTAELGPVKAVVRLEPDKPVIGDAVNVTVEVTAEDGIDLLMPEFGQSLDRFAIREFVPKETVDDKGRTVSTQRYVLEPPSSGPQSIPPLMIEFVDRRPGQRPAPEGEDAYEIVTERIPFEVASVVPQNAGTELKPARGRLEPLREPGSAWPWIAALAVLAAIAAPLLYRYIAAARVRERRRSAYEVARARLDALLSRGAPTQPQAIDAFFVELTAIIRRYLEDHFELRAPELTTEEFLNVASASPDLSEDHQRFLRDFLRRADMVKFARFIPSPADIESASQAASRFLDQTRAAAHAASASPPMSAHGAAHA
ncbi:MAG TPA: hypothetical protein VEL28_19585 [Candidatus Binatia bacterium]|nr:hypothetical protein [Candidatus Binatia bacterium]